MAQIKTITLIADTHNQHQQIFIDKCDVLIIAGDYSRKNLEKEVKEFIKWLARQPARYKILINGNHDRFSYRHPKAFNHLIAEHEIIFLENNSISIEGINFWGSPVTVPVIDGIYNQVERKNSDRKLIWDTIPDYTDIVITHSPPFGIKDAVRNNEHLGCKFLYDKILQIKPKYHLFGHIHQDYGEYESNNIHFINGAIVNNSEEVIRKPISFSYAS